MQGRAPAQNQAESPVKLTCRACGYSGEFRVFSAREMLFGRRERLRYGECPECRSYEIVEIPSNLGDYYPSDYYSLQAPPERSKKPGWARQRWASWLLRGPGGAGAANRMKRKYPFFHWCRVAGCGLESRVLDVGCGSGGMLRRMQRYGFTHLEGVDPYTSIEADEPGFRVRRLELEAVDGTFDLIMLHHVLEHLVDPKRSLEVARTKLNPDGRVLIRIPVAGSHTAQVYGPDWFNLDPPRHLLVPSRGGMERLAVRSGLKVVDTEFDGMETGFLISELYQKDIPYVERPEEPAARRKHFRDLAEEYNRKGEGDQGVFWLAAG